MDADGAADSRRRQDVPARMKQSTHMKEPLKVFFDGKLVGEVPDTGDRQTNLEAMTRLVKEAA
jgi:hypothetical protein